MHAHKTAAGLSIATIFLNRFSSFREKILRKKRKISQASQKKTKTKSHTLLYYMLIFKDEQTPAKNKAER